MPRLARTCVLLAVLAMLAALPETASAGDGGGTPEAQSARGCGLSTSQQRSFRPTAYVIRLHARGTSCRRAKRLVRAYHRCRARRGGRRGRCPRVRGYRCRERRFDSISTQFNSRVSCRRGGRRVSHLYQQNT